MGAQYAPVDVLSWEVVRVVLSIQLLLLASGQEVIALHSERNNEVSRPAWTGWLWSKEARTCVDVDKSGLTTSRKR